MEIYDWLLLALAAGSLAVGLVAVVTGLRGLALRQYGGAVMFLLLGACFSAASVYTVYLALWAPVPDA